MQELANPDQLNPELKRTYTGIGGFTPEFYQRELIAAFKNYEQIRVKILRHKRTKFYTNAPGDSEKLRRHDRHRRDRAALRYAQASMNVVRLGLAPDPTADPKE